MKLSELSKPKQTKKGLISDIMGNISMLYPLVGVSFFTRIKHIIFIKILKYILKGN